LKIRSRPENEKPGNEKLNSRFKPGKKILKPGNGHFLGPFLLQLLLEFRVSILI
jgi:hypothetical protein